MIICCFFLLTQGVLNDTARHLWKKAFVVSFVEDSATGTVRPSVLVLCAFWKESSNLNQVVYSFTLAFPCWGSRILRSTRRRRLDFSQVCLKGTHSLCTFKWLVGSREGQGFTKSPVRASVFIFLLRFSSARFPPLSPPPPANVVLNPHFRRLFDKFH